MRENDFESIKWSYIRRVCVPDFILPISADTTGAQNKPPLIPLQIEGSLVGHPDALGL